MELHDPSPQLTPVVKLIYLRRLSVEWVYNAADIDSAKVVWARDMTPALNRELIGYFKDRRMWLVEPDCDPPKVSNYAF